MSEDIHHIHKYGVLWRADQLVSTANRLFIRLKGGPPVNTAVFTDTDGSTVFAKRVFFVYTATITGVVLTSSSSTDGRSSSEGTEDWLYSGLITDPLLVTDAETLIVSAKEFTPTQSTYLRESFTRRTRTLSERLGLAASPLFVTPGVDLNSQSGYLTPSMYSGKMSTAVQLYMGIAKAPKLNPIHQGRLAWVHAFYLTHNLSIDARGDWWVVEVSPAGVRIAPLAYLERVKYPRSEQTQTFKGMPSHADTSLIIDLLGPDDVLAYAECTPVTSSMHGWSCNEIGSEMMCVGLFTQGQDKFTRVFKLSLRLDGESVDDFSATFEMISEAPIYQPARWWKSEYNTARFEAHDAVRERNLAINPQHYQFFVDGDESWNMYMGGENIHKPDYATPGWGSAGHDCSWWNTIPPLQYYERVDARTAKAHTIGPLPEAPPEVNEVDAPVFVCCVDNEFHIGSYYWFYAFQNEYCTRHVGSGDAADDVGGTGNSSFSTTWYAYRGPYGVPPTLYTTHFDTRRPGFFISMKFDPGVALYNAVMAKGRNRPVLDLNGYDSDSMGVVTERVDWCKHTEAYLPYGARDDYQMLDLDSPGSMSFETNLKSPEKHACGAFRTTALRYYDADYQAPGSVVPCVEEIPEMLQANLGFFPQPVGYAKEEWYLEHMLDDSGENFISIGPIPIAIPLVLWGSRYLPFYRPVDVSTITPESIADRRIDLWDAYERRYSLAYQLPNDPFLDTASNDFVFVEKIHIGHAWGILPENKLYNTDGALETPIPVPDYPDSSGYSIVELDEFCNGGKVYGLADAAYDPFAVWRYNPNDVQLWVYARGLPSVYREPTVNRYNCARLKSGTTVVGQFSQGSSFVGERFSFYRFAPTGDFTSYGALPGGLTLAPQDILCPVGITEQG